MVKSLTSFVKSLDAFGDALDLNFRGQNHFNTVCGGIITAFLYTTFLLYTFQQGIAFVKKTNISVSEYEIVDLDGPYEPHDFRDMKGGLLVALVAPGSIENMLDSLDPSYGTLQIDLIEKNESPEGITGTLTPLTLQPCTLESYELEEVPISVGGKLLGKKVSCLSHN